MLRSFSEFKFYQSFRIPVEQADELRFLVEITNELGKGTYIEDALLRDVSVTGLGFASVAKLSVGTELLISLQFKRAHIDLTGRVVRAFSDLSPEGKVISSDRIIYGIEIDEDKRIKNFLKQYIMSFSSERLKDCLIQSALKENYAKASDSFEMFSLILSLFKDITNFGDKDGFIDSMMEEMVRILNAQRASIFLINPVTNELEAVAALGVDKTTLKFDYRLGIAGSVFTTGVALNIDTERDKSRFNEAFDKKLGFKTRSIICYPIHNREDKIIGVIEVLNKRNETRFTEEDEKTMKVLSLIFSSVFHNYNPISEESKIRRFSTPFDREHAFIGTNPHIAQLRKTIIKIKDIEAPVLISGEVGVGKTLFAQILHYEGQRGLNKFEMLNCGDPDHDRLWKDLFGPSDEDSKLVSCKGGSILLREIEKLPMKFQKELMTVIKNNGLPESKFTIDARFMATTSTDLSRMVEEFEFDPELYEFISKSYIKIEPLRKREDDVEDLISYFLKVECRKQGLLFKNFAPKAIEKLKNHDWPGNVKELKTLIERIVLYNPKLHLITEAELENSAAPLFDIDMKQRTFGDNPYISDSTLLLKDRVALMERDIILAEIKRHNGNKSQAAKAMGISREALRKKLLISQEVLDQLEKPQTEKAAA